MKNGINQIEEKVNEFANEFKKDKPSSHREGPIAEKIEEHTSKIPSDVFLWAAGGAVAASLILEMTKKRDLGNFVATWVPTILTVGMYNKMVKLHGSNPNHAM